MTSPESTDPLAAEVIEVADGAFAYVQADGGWFLNNAGFLRGPDGLTAIDTCATERRTRAFVEAATRTTGQSVLRVVNTHHHGDHTYGNHLVDGATVIGHDGVRAALLRWQEPPAPVYWTEVDWGSIRPNPPVLTFADRLQVHLERTSCEVRYVGTPAHTLSDSIVWLPEERVLFAGDLLFNGVTPLMSQGSIDGALAVLNELEAMEPHVVVPGHGPVGGPEVIGDVRRYLLKVVDLAAAGLSAGLKPLDVARECDLGEFVYLADPERLVANLHRAYAEANGAARGARIDTARAFQDMVTLNGGKPLTCNA